jgi:hypothetical protein
MKDDFEELDDDQLYENYEAYKALVEAGVPKKDALKKTGLTAQILKDLEEEENEDDYKADFKEVWGQDDEDFDESEWSEESLDDDEFEDSYEEDYSEDYDESGYDDKD